MNMATKRIFSVLISTLLIHSQVHAQSSSYLGVGKYNDNLSGTEYTSGNQPGTVLMRVNLWGAVHRPGIHNIPVKTDLMTLISYAGGPKDKALLDDVVIKREIGNTRKVIEVDVEDLITGTSHHHVELAPNDIVVIPKDQPLLGDDAIGVLTVLTFLLSSVVAISVIDRNSKQ